MDFPVLLKQTVQSSDKFKCTHRILLWLLHPVKAAEQDLDTDQKIEFIPAFKAEIKKVQGIMPAIKYIK